MSEYEKAEMHGSISQQYVMVAAQGDETVYYCPCHQLAKSILGMKKALTIGFCILQNVMIIHNMTN